MRWHSEGGADFIAFTATLALGKMSQNEVDTPLTALVEPAIEGLKKLLLLRRTQTESYRFPFGDAYNRWRRWFGYFLN